MNADMFSSARAEHRDHLRAAILGAARELLVQHGYEAFSMRKLASRIDCSVGGLYLYFDNKESLFQTLVEENFERLTSLLDGLYARNQGRDPVEMLKKGLYTYIEFGLRNSSDYRFAFLLRQQDSSKVPAPVVTLGRMVARCVEERRFLPADIELTTQKLWAAVHGVTSLLIQRPAYPWASKAKLVEQLVANLIAGLLPQQTPQEVQSRTLRASVA